MAKRASLKDNSPLDTLIPTTPPKAAKKAAKGPDKPRQTTIMLFDHQLDWLDQKTIEARSNGGKRIRKAVLIRSLIDLAIDSPVDLSGLGVDEELAERFEKAIKSK